VGIREEKIKGVAMNLSNSRKKAEQFIKNETEFHLGRLVTESQHPKTMNFGEVVRKNTQSGLKMLFSVDEDIILVYKKVLETDKFNELVNSFYIAALNGKRICFSGCGSTGRLGILLEKMWRTFWNRAEELFPVLKSKIPFISNSSYSIMTGGDFALIRSLENFEDFQTFGRQQVKEAKIKKRDVFVAITEGGETSSVIGTVWQAFKSEAKVFFVCNNPTVILSKYLQRSRQVIKEGKITKLDLTTGPMAITGSTRMQAITIELLVIGTALEMAITKILKGILTTDELSVLNITNWHTDDYIEKYKSLLSTISSNESLDELASIVELEEEVYRHKGFVTYFSDSFMLDILTDTTERAPTFSIPHFKKNDDFLSPQSWAFVKNPFLGTKSAWFNMLMREPRGLNWDSNLYKSMGAPSNLCESPPKINNSEIYKFRIGYEDDPSRYQNAASTAIIFLAGGEVSKYEEENSLYGKSFENQVKNYNRKRYIIINDVLPENLNKDIVMHIPYSAPKSPLNLFLHTGIKLIFNTISTATMARMGRIEKNVMIYVNPTNKKLIDRGSRIISDLTGLKYLNACEALYETIGLIQNSSSEKKFSNSPVKRAIERIKNRI